MKALQRVWDVFRHGENIDLYMMLIFVVSLTFLNLIGITSKSSISSITLAVLALLTVAALSIRYRLENKLKSFIPRAELNLLEQYPDNMAVNIERCKEIWLMGGTLTQIMEKYFSVFKKKLESENMMIRILFVDKKGMGHSMSGIRSSFGVEHQRGRLQNNLDYLANLRTIAPNKVEIRTIDSPLAYEVVMIDPKTKNGVIYIRLYNFGIPAEPEPKLVVSCRDTKWFKHFEWICQSWWNKSTPWLRSDQVIEEEHENRRLNSAYSSRSI